MLASFVFAVWVSENEKAIQFSQDTLPFFAQMCCNVVVQVLWLEPDKQLVFPLVLL